MLGLASLRVVDKEILHKVVFCESLGFAAFVFGVLLCRSAIPRQVLINYMEYRQRYKLRPYRVPIFLLLIILFVTFFPLFRISALGLINKQEITRSGEIFLRLYSLYYPLIIYTTAYAIACFENGKEKYAYVVMLLGVFYSTIALGITGERDILFYFTLMLLLYLCDIRKKIHGVVLIIILLSGVVLLPVSHMLKGFVIAEDKANISEVLKDGFVGLLQSDFTSAGSNLYNIVYYTNEFHYGERIRNDFLRVFSSSLFGINDNAISSTKWYKDYFINSNGAGRGFSIVAEGYLDFGYVGIVIIMFIIGFFLQTLYRYRYLNSLVYVYYTFTLMTACYCIRADMANFINNSLKLGFIPLLVIYFNHHLNYSLRRKKLSNN